MDGADQAAGRAVARDRTVVVTVVEVTAAGVHHRKVEVLVVERLVSRQERVGVEIVLFACGRLGGRGRPIRSCSEPGRPSGTPLPTEER